jgi:SAM-dependent methyltransferase
VDAQHDHIQSHYGPRALDYLTSTTHATGPDLDQIEAAVAARRPARVLDLGCGGGHVAYRAAPHCGQVIACDVTPAMLSVVHEAAAARGLANIAVQRAAAEHLPFADAAFDMVLSRFSAHHWNDLDAGLRETARVLAPTGSILFVDSTAPAAPLLDTHLQTLELLRDPSHVRNYTAAEWAAALGRAGLRITGLTARRLRMDFAAWVARTRAGPERIAALMSVQREAASSVQRHFAIEADGSWMLDTLAIAAEGAWLPGSGEADEYAYDIPLPERSRRRARAPDGTLQPPRPLRTRKPTYKDRAVALVRALGTVSPDDLRGACVYRCQIKKLCEAGLLTRVSYGRYKIGPAAHRLLGSQPTTDEHHRAEAA